ncbi:MAG TPA: CpsD/CapB family tyrosine-protein kinase [Candidatus Sulfotelmatobacter sp.]
MELLNLEPVIIPERAQTDSLLSTQKGTMSQIYDVLTKTHTEAVPIESLEKAIADDFFALQAGLGDEVQKQTPPGLTLDELLKRCAKPAWNLGPDSIVFCNEQSFSPCAEQFRYLRSRLYRARQKMPLRTLLVTSTLPNEGKTFVTLNLGQAIARQHERRALLIDVDLRSSRLHLALGAPSSPGLSDFLCGEADECSIIQADSQSNLFFIPAGRPVSNPSELLSCGQFKALLDRLAQLFDWVILDAPPVLPVSDASVLAGVCDGVLFVVRAGETAFDQAQMACQEFRRKNLVGVVLNHVEESVAAAGGVYSYYGGRTMEQSKVASLLPFSLLRGTVRHGFCGALHTLARRLATLSAAAMNNR